MDYLKRMNEQITQKMTDKKITLRDINSKSSYGLPGHIYTEETQGSLRDDSSLEPIDEKNKLIVPLDKPKPQRKFSAKMAFAKAMKGIKASNIMMKAVEEEQEDYFPDGSNNKALKDLEQRKKLREESDERKKTKSQIAAQNINHVKANAKLTSKHKDMK